jgi:hypothetical protein
MQPINFYESENEVPRKGADFRSQRQRFYYVLKRRIDDEYDVKKATGIRGSPV